MKIAIIGAGASGLACAIECLTRGKKQGRDISLTLYECRDRAGKKLLATGNGRCNMMNENEGASYFGDDAFARYALSRYNVRSNLSFFASMGLYTVSDSEGRVYPMSNQAAGVLDALRLECERLGGEIVCSREITRVIPRKTYFDLGDGIRADRVVFACGGKAGVKGFTAYEMLREMGYSIIKPLPALTKLKVSDTKSVKQLRGIRHKAVLTLYEKDKRLAREKGEVLFTDYGLSGIGIMQLSSFISRSNFENVRVSIDNIPSFSHRELTEALSALVGHSPEMKCESLLSGFMPKKLGELIIKQSGAGPSEPIGSLNGKQLEKIASLSKALTFSVQGLRGFEDAQVTSGGVDTRQFNMKTLESLRHKGLYCIGEMLNIDGPCGGYNLMWAWSSGRLCGESIING